MKITRIATGLAIATLTLVSCNKDTQHQPETGMTNFDASIESLGVKVELAYRYDVLWQNEDEIAVKGETGSSVYSLAAGAGTTSGTFSLKTGSAITGAADAYYPASLMSGSELIWPEAQQGTTVPMYAHTDAASNETQLGFSSLGGVLRVFFSTAAENIKLTSATLKTLGETPALLSGAFTVSNGQAVIAPGGGNSIVLKFPEGGLAVGTSAKVLDFAIPAGTYADGFELLFDTTDGSFCTMASTQSFTVLQNSVSVLVLNATKFKNHKPEEAVNGLFTVNAQGKQVYFAKGNLKYDVKKQEWGFFDKQYEYQKAYSTDLVSLFTWGLGEWSTDPAAESYAGSNAAFVDWGTTIDDMGTWRTLSREEWLYLLWDRGDNLKVFRNWVDVCGVKCIVTAPDGNTVEIKESYTEQEWAEAEAAGFVCLPNAGYRGTGSIDFSYGGYYWASNEKVANTGYCVNFSAKTWTASGGLGKIYPASVRLVADR